MLRLESPLRDGQDRPAIGCCKRCGSEIYRYDGPVVAEDGRRMHMECFEEYVEELLRDSPAIVAECLGMKYEEAV